MTRQRSEDNRQVLVQRTAAQAEVLVAELLESIVCEAVGRRNICHLALAGGTTPRALYQQLAQRAMTTAVPWHQVEIFFGDERDVPQDHVESNYRTVQRTLLDHVPVDLARVHPMPADAGDLHAAAAEYEQTIRAIVPAGDGPAGGIPQFDLILLGMGGDGHTGSLFACTPKALDERKKLILVHFVPVLGRSRMTFTFPLINAARNTILLITGGDKADAAAALLSDDPEAAGRLPARRICPAGGKLIIVLDAAAARKTGHKPK
ncbi:MAG: 6-phosphogluconolactonase [Planctomycetota bacterium]|nr:6-phosphogluconolactonase [Planctomycetota bacterium]